MGWTAKFQEQQCLNLDAQNQYINNIETTYGGNNHHRSFMEVVSYLGIFNELLVPIS